MKIGIDAKWFFDGPPSGKVVVSNIVTQILNRNNEDDFYILLNQSDKGKKFPINKENIRLIYLPNCNNALTNIFIVPFFGLSKPEISRNRVDFPLPLSPTIAQILPSLILKLQLEITSSLPL